MEKYQKIATAWFQFHKGSIKTHKILTIKIIKLISIP